jgi:hypothetical protein
MVTDEDYINDEELMTRGMEHLFMVCSTCGHIDDLGPIALYPKYAMCGVKNYHGFHFLSQMCPDCWQGHMRETTRLHHIQDALDDIFEESTREPGTGWRPFECFYRGLITATELHERIHEMVDKAILFAVCGDSVIK